MSLRTYKSLVFFTVYLLLMLPSYIIGSSDYSIVFVHIGSNIPKYTTTALSQARKFNQDCQIILLAEEEAINTFNAPKSSENITYITCESLKKTKEHKYFTKKSTLNKDWRDGFWRYTSERFLYLQDLIVMYDLKNVFHMEYDNMLYTDLSNLTSVFENQYQGIAATFDNDDRCVPGFIFIPNATEITLLAKCFASNAHKNYNDMKMVSIFKEKYGITHIDYLPIITREYLDNYPLKSNINHTTTTPENFHKNIELFQSVFDAAALGQYLGGIDPRNGRSVPGFVNESCLFQADKLVIEWYPDELNRNVPYIVYPNKKYRINNLHIHSKKLDKFKS